MREKSFFGSGGGFIWKLIFMIAAPQTRENHTALIMAKLCNDTNVFTSLRLYVLCVSPCYAAALLVIFRARTRIKKFWQGQRD